MNKDIPTDRVDLTHHLQRQILVALRQDGSASYQQLKPDGVEGNAFNYHLRNLRKSDLIAHEDGLYVLTPTGYLVADAFSMGNQRLMLRPHLYTVLLITSREYVLVYEHARPPFAGTYSLLSGKLHYGDTYDASIAREVRRRQLSADYKATAICPFNVRFLQQGEMILQRSGVLWHLDYKGPLETRETTNGKSRWVKRSELESLPCLPEVHDGLYRLDAASHEPIDSSYDV